MALGTGKKKDYMEECFLILLLFDYAAISIFMYYYLIFGINVISRGSKQ